MLLLHTHTEDCLQSNCRSISHFKAFSVTLWIPSVIMLLSPEEGEGKKNITPTEEIRAVGNTLVHGHLMPQITINSNSDLALTLIGVRPILPNSPVLQKRGES